MSIEKISLLELFKKYEQAQAIYMRTAGTFKFKAVTNREVLLVDDARQRVQDFRNELLTRLSEVN